MSMVAATLILLLQSDPKDRLFDAIRESNVEATQKALADLALGDGAKAARAVMAALPRARERLNFLIAATMRARENYVAADTSFGFNINEATVKQRSLEVAAARVREAGLRALEGEKVYQSILDIFGFLKPEAIPVLGAEAERTALWPLKCEILEGLGALGAKTELAVVLDRETAPAPLAAALGASPSEQGAKFLAHPQWQVRLAALDALRRSRDSVGPIVESLARNDVRYRRAATAALGRLTDTELPADPDVWRDWWKANRDDFEAGLYNPRAARQLPGPGRTTAFYDVPVHSSRVCFVIDRSKSMREQDRFNDARRELKRLLESMPDGSLVNVIFFGWTQNCFSKMPRTLDAQSRRELEIFIDRCGLESGTDLYGALEKALTMVGNPDTGRLHEDGVDTIVVLSDGQATVGRIIDDELLAWVIARRARYLRPTFSTISLGDSKSLRLLAERTGGEYRAK
ncbi:MAG TPA: vWA domain-containing protein [Planctomycetota bacterium]|nr:vWA domain-containing protein [Planctomycetota bacterium]